MTTSPELSTEIRQSVIDVVGIAAEREGLAPAVDLFDQGVTSLVFILIVARLNEMYEVAIDVTGLEEASIDALAALVDGQLRKNRSGRAAR